MRNRYTEEDHLSFPELSTPFSRSDAQHFLSLYKNNKTKTKKESLILPASFFLFFILQLYRRI